MRCGGGAQGVRLRTSLGDLRLVFFLYTSLEISPKLGYVFRIRALARLISASSKEKIRCLDYFYFKFEVKFANFTRQDPYLENVNLNLRRFAQAKQCRRLERAVGLERAWERKGRRFVSRTPSSPIKREKQIQKGTLLLQPYLAIAKQSVI